MKKMAIIFFNILMFNLPVFAEEKYCMEKGFEQFMVEPIRFKQTNADSDYFDVFRFHKYKNDNGVHTFYKDTIDEKFILNSVLKGTNMHEITNAMFIDKEYMFIGNIQVFDELTNTLLKTIEVKVLPSTQVVMANTVSNEEDKTTFGVHLGKFSEGEYLIKNNLCINPKLKSFHKEMELKKLFIGEY